MTEDFWNDAEWIIASATGEITDRYFEYLTDFTMEETACPDTGDSSCMFGDSSYLGPALYISAYSQYAVYLNGQFIDCGQYDGYEDMKFYDIIPLADFLRLGNNRLLIRHYVCGADFFTRQIQIPGIIFKVMYKGVSLCSSTPACLSREDVRYCGDAERLTPQLGFNFSFDANKELPKYAPSLSVPKQKHIQMRPTEKLAIAGTTKGTLTAQGVFLEWDQSAPKALRCQHAYFSALRKKELMPEGLQKGHMAKTWRIPDGCQADGVYFIFDLAGEKSGFLDFSLTLLQACEVLLSIGEHLDDLRVRSAIGEDLPTSDHLAPGRRNFTFRYMAQKGENVFFHPFQRFDLRYLQLMVFAPEGTIGYTGVREALYPLTHRPIPVTDGLHRLIWETGCRTLRLCMHEHYEDCPWREQALYTMDSRVQMLCGYYAFGEYKFPKANLRLIAHSLGTDHLLALCAPGKAQVNIPSFTAVFVRQVLEYIRYSGDLAFANEMLPVLTDIVTGFEHKITPDGLIPQLPGQWNFYEWEEGLDGLTGLPSPTCDSLLNAFVSDAFSCFSEIAKIASQETLAAKYQALHNRINASLHTCFYREAYGGYASFLKDDKPTHELTQAMLLYVGAVPENLWGKVAATLKSGSLIPCSLSMTIYKYDALMAVSKSNYPYIIREIEAIWGRMLLSGTDTFWETVIGADDFDYAGSLCHGWSAVPVYFFGKYQ